MSGAEAAALSEAPGAASAPFDRSGSQAPHPAIVANTAAARAEEIAQARMT
ncbi:MAG TPA: hypothetical protein VIF15_19415 [Polyangiaceae bacterium]|jgi:hypothetical protein